MMFAPVRDALAPYLIWIKLGLAAAAGGGIPWAVVHHEAPHDSAPYQRGYNTRMAEEAKAAAAAKAEDQRRDQAAAEATHAMQTRLASALPQIEETTHATAERVRIVYRDHPVPADCVRPDGVQRDLDAARAAANAAAAPAH
jgi:hypothetical protein